MDSTGNAPGNSFGEQLGVDERLDVDIKGEEQRNDTREPPTKIDDQESSPSRNKHVDEKSAAKEEKHVEAVDEKADPADKGEVTIVDNATDEKKKAEDEPEDESKYLTGMKLALLTLGLALSTFVIALDNTIIATAIPRITTVFDSLNDVGWYGSSYLLTTTSLQPSFGKVYAYFDVKWTFLGALIVFERRLPLQA